MATDYNFSFLSAADFEDLAKDILEAKLRRHFHVYGGGSDHGIDLCSDEAEPEVIGQAKRYIKSSLKELMDALKGEHEKLLGLGYQPKEYYIFTTFDISGSTKDNIVAMFADFGVDAGHIYGQSDLCAFLDDSSNQAILKKNFKLYLTSINVLELVLHADAQNRTAYLHDEIKESLPKFYKTSIFSKASKLLAEKRCVVLIGGPGSGKTITSNMLVSSIIAHDPEYGIVYGEDEQCKDLLALIHPGVKQIVYVDDMIGRVAVEITSGESNDLKMIVAAVLRDPSKYLILNSRTALWNSLADVNAELVDKINASGVQTVNCDETTPYEKARILYNHLSFQRVSQAKIDDVCLGKRYRKIIDHPNYSPRLIESVTKPSFLKSVSDDAYADAIIKTLDNPDKFWEEEIEKRCTPEDRVLLLALFSLTNYWTDVDRVKQVFSKYKTGLNDLDPTRSSFEKSLKKLNNELVQVSMFEGEAILGFANPSVYQYVKKFIFDSENDEYRKRLISLSVYLDQYHHLINGFETSDELKELICSGRFYSLKGSNQDLDVTCVEGIVRMRIITDETKKTLREIFAREEKMGRSLFSIFLSDFFSLIAKSLSHDDFGLKPLFFDSERFKAFLRMFGPDEMAKICQEVIAALPSEERDQFWAINHDVLADVLAQIAAKAANEELQAEASDAPIDSEDGYPDVEGYLDEITEDKINAALSSPRVRDLSALFGVDPSVDDVSAYIDNEENAKNGVGEPDYEAEEDRERDPQGEEAEIDVLFSSISSKD